jgi:hypothetical protein
LLLPVPQKLDKGFGILHLLNLFLILIRIVLDFLNPFDCPYLLKLALGARFLYHLLHFISLINDIAIMSFVTFYLTSVFDIIQGNSVFLDARHFVEDSRL